MSKYGSGMTFGAACNLEKEQLKMALRGKLATAVTEEGCVYEDADKAACDRFVLEAFDNVVFEAKAAMDAGRALETILAAHKVQPKASEYLEAIEAEKQKYNDYIYEQPLE